MSETSVVIRVDDELKSAFASAARAADRTASQLLRDFMRDFVRKQTDQAEYDVWLRRKVESARGEVHDGRGKSSEEVEAYFAQRRESSLRKADEADR
jgi:predicted transcriptional regulator